MHITVSVQTAKQKERKRAGWEEFTLRIFPARSPTLERINEYFNENYSEVEDDDDE